MVVCSTCTHAKTVTKCTDSLVLGQITDINTDVYIFVQSENGHQWRENATTDANGVVDIDLTSSANKIMWQRPYFIWVTLQDVDPSQREPLYVAGKEVVCWEVCFDFRYSGDDSVDYTKETLTLSESFTEITPEIWVDNDIRPDTDPTDGILFWKNQGSQADFKPPIQRPIWDTSSDSVGFVAGGGKLSTRNYTMDSYHHMIALTSPFSTSGDFFSQWDNDDVSASRFKYAISASGYFTGHLASGATDHNGSIPIDLFTEWHVLEAIWDGIHHTLYIDGLRYQQQTTVGMNPTTINNSTLDVVLGGVEVTDGSYLGLFKALKFYGEAISPAQRQRDILDFLKRV